MVSQYQFQLAIQLVIRFRISPWTIVLMKMTEITNMAIFDPQMTPDGEKLPKIGQKSTNHRSHQFGWTYLNSSI